MKVDAFDFELPQDRIALHPAEPRDSARMLVVPHHGSLQDQHVTDLVDILERRRRARGQRHACAAGRTARDASSRRRAPARRSRSTSTSGSMPTPGGHSPGRARSCTCSTGSSSERGGSRATVTGKGDTGEVTLSFDLGGAALDDAIRAQRRRCRCRPISRPSASPRSGTRSTTRPSMRRARAPWPRRRPGSISPRRCCRGSATRASAIERLTLHVGAGTFLPVKADDTDDHVMHAEWGEIDQATAERIKAAKAKGGRVVAVGTTSLRLLETRGARDRALCSRSPATPTSSSRPASGSASVDLLMTNFHLPRSTLFMLVSALRRPDPDAERLHARDQPATTGSIRMAMPACCIGSRRTRISRNRLRSLPFGNFVLEGPRHGRYPDETLRF